MKRLLAIVGLVMLLGGLAAATNLQQVNTTSPQTLSNKTLDNTNVLNTVMLNSPVMSGIVTGNYSFGGNAILLSPTFNSPIFSGIATGVYTLGGTLTLTSPFITTPTMSGGGILGGTYTGTYTLAGSPTFTAPAISGATFSGTQLGTYTFAGTGTFTAPAISNPTFSGVAFGSLTNASFTTPTITGGLVAADPTANLGITSKQYSDQHGFTTGDVKLTLKTTADTSWVLMNDTTIGDVSSGATGRANADTLALYTLIWTNVTDQWAPVAGGRGGSAAADFAAEKALALPKTLGRALAGYGVGTTKAAGVNGDVDTAADTLTVASNSATWITGMPVVFTLTSGTITGLTSGNTYYIVRNSATLVKLASSLANAQNGTVVDMTAKSSPVWSVTYTFTTRAIGEQVGEESHAQSLTELLAHTHTAGQNATAASGATSPVFRDTSSSGNATSSVGGNAAMNVLQPSTFLNVMIKLRAPDELMAFQ